MADELLFDDSAVDFVLDAFDNTVDEDGYIVKSDTGERVRTPDGDPLTPADLGGIAKGSEVYVEDNYVSVLEYVKDNRSSNRGATRDDCRLAPRVHLRVQLRGR